MGRNCHPLLSGRRSEAEKYNHGLSSAELLALASLCEVFLPPLPSVSLEGKEDLPSQALESFYKASGAQAPVPDKVAEIVLKRLLTEAVILIRVVLLMLSTKLGYVL